MSVDARTLCPNEDEVAVEVLRGEAVLINLATGHYYSMDKAGAVIWEMVARRMSVGDMLRALTQQYDVSPGQAREELGALLDDLEAERLAVPCADGPRSAEGRPSVDERLPWEVPRLNKYSDMADMLALDPPLPGLKDIPWKDSGRG